MRGLFCSIAVFLAATSTTATSETFKSKPCDQVTIMAYNVENLWDAVNDSDQGDYTYLPLSLKKKLPMRELCSGKGGFRLNECLNLDSPNLN